MISLLALGGSTWAASPAMVPLPQVAVTGNVVVASKTSGKPGRGNVAISLTPVAGLRSGRALSAAPNSRPRIIQQHKQFSPHLLVVTVGTTVDFPNMDPFFHNAFSMYEGKRFDLGLYEGGATKSVTFASEGVCYIFCNIHPEMSAVVVVVDTPYSAVSNAAGRFSIPDVPPGRYTLAVWHERYVPQTAGDFPREITVPSTDADLGIIRLAESDRIIAPHLNKYGRAYTPAPGTGYIIIKK